MGARLVKGRALGDRVAAVTIAMEGQGGERGIRTFVWARQEEKKKWIPTFSGAKGHCIFHRIRPCLRARQCSLHLGQE